MFAHRSFFASNPSQDERDFALRNINKHRGIQWLNLAMSVLIWVSLSQASPETFPLLINALIAPVMLLGSAWFAISFGAVPARFINFTLSITTWMYAAFKVSLSAMFLGIGFVAPQTLIPVLLFIYISIDMACIPYDTVDGLKAGLDEYNLRHSKVALRYYHNQGINEEVENKTN